MIKPTFFRLGSIYIIAQDVLPLPKNLNLWTHKKSYKPHVPVMNKRETAISEYPDVQICNPNVRMTKWPDVQISKCPDCIFCIFLFLHARRLPPTLIRLLRMDAHRIISLLAFAIPSKAGRAQVSQGPKGPKGPSGRLGPFGAQGARLYATKGYSV